VEKMTVATKDPVCGMMVEMPYRHKYVYDGQEYGFCSHECELKFESDPEKYVVGQDQKSES